MKHDQFEKLVTGLMAIAAVCSSAVAAPSFAQQRMSAGRLTASGAPDTSFDGDGRFRLDVAPACQQLAGAALDFNGRVVAVGSCDVTFAGEQFMVVRFNSNGTLDTSFGSNGFVFTNFSSSTRERATAVAIDLSGAIVVAGWATLSNGQQQFALARYLSNGALDTSFDFDGKVLTPFTSSTGALATSVTTGLSAILVGGYATISGQARFALARYNVDGSLDTSFEQDGKVLTDFSSTTQEYVAGVTTDASFRPVAVGYTLNNSTGQNQIAVARYTSSGTLDTSFSGDGKLVIDIAGSSEFAFAVRTDSSNRIITAGGATNPSGSGFVFALTRVNASGSLDSSFGSGGIALGDFTGSTNEFATTLVAASNNRWVAVGIAFPSSLAAMAAARFNSNGTLDTSYAGDGTATLAFSGRSAFAQGATISGDKVTMVGYSE